MYSENDLPIHLKDGETLTLQDGTTVRFEGNGEAKDVMVNEGFAPEVQLFPGNEWFLDCAGCQYRMEAMMDDDLLVEKI